MQRAELFYKDMNKPIKPQSRDVACNVPTLNFMHVAKGIIKGVRLRITLILIFAQ